MKTSTSPSRTAHISRRGFLGVCAAGTIGLTGGGLYARYIEPNWLRISRMSVPIADLQHPLRIAHLSDFHASASVPVTYIAESIERTLALEPDVICLTGDYITRLQPEGPAYGEALTRLAAAAPSYAIFGNHDGGAWAQPHGGYASTDPVRKLLQDAGIQILHNRAATITIRDQSFRLVGVGDLWANEFEPQIAFAGASSHGPVVLMSHNPDSKLQLQGYAWDLMLCGHTHGGQIRLPLLGTPFAPVRDHSMVDGLHRWDQRWIHITRGVGNLHGLRFNCRPEISLLDLQAVRHR